MLAGTRVAAVRGVQRSAAHHCTYVRACATQDVPEFDVFATGSLDRSIRLWSLTTLQMKAVLRGHQKGITHMAYGHRLLLRCGRSASQRRRALR